jgi:phage replication-related protein YjqB (UPF0714/DUF867 family)
MLDKYASFAALEACEVAGTDYSVNVVRREESGVLIVAPHGGNIEIGTSELGAHIAGTDYSLFTFDGHKARGLNRDLHITSHNFDHPGCVTLAARHSIVLGVHGCKGESTQVYVGGLDTDLTTLLTARLLEAGLPASAAGHKYPGRNPRNICNRGARQRGAQLELSLDLRGPGTRALIASIVRGALADHLRRLDSDSAGATARPSEPAAPDTSRARPFSDSRSWGDR